jgi:hypothetical protein
MKRIKMTICLTVAAVLVAAGQGFGLIQYNDGQTHSVGSLITTDVWVDYQSPGISTTLNVLDGSQLAYPYSITGYQNSCINVLGGNLWIMYSHDSSSLNFIGTGQVRSVYASNGSQVNVSSGAIEYLQTMDTSIAYISGGAFAHGGYLVEGVSVMNNSHVIITGGIFTTPLQVQDSGILTIQGFNFAVDGKPVGYGELSSLLGGNGSEPARTLTGTLQSGQTINTTFYIDGNQARISLATPEPATLLLLGLGGMILRKHRS